MPGIRVVHTADVHIGARFGRYPDAVRERLVGERLAALGRVVELANRAEAQLLVVAGDLFDRVSVSAAEVDGAVRALAAFEGDEALVVPGNHDYVARDHSDLWSRFERSAEGSCIVPLIQPQVHELKIGESSVRVYPCPCPAKHSAENVIGWVAEREKRRGVLHIGVAHGNVEGLGMDDDQRYFNMTESELRAAGLDVWLLGHIHVPAPRPGTAGRPAYFMAGTPEPDSVRCSHGGHAWLVDLEPGGATGFQQLDTGAVRFERFRRRLEHQGQVDELRRECEAVAGPNTVLDLQLEGRLKRGELDRLNAAVKDLVARCLHVGREQTIAPVLEASEIARRFPDGTLPNRLLIALLADTEHQGDAQLALEIIESVAER